MHKIDSSTATVGNEFTEGNPQTGVRATKLSGKWLNSVQRELIAAVEAAGQSPTDADDTQLMKGLRGLIGAAPHRQSVIFGRTNASGQSEILAALTGLDFQILGATTPAVFAFGAGADGRGFVDRSGIISANLTLTMPANSTRYVYADRNPATGAVTAGLATQQPTYGEVHPNSPATGQHSFLIPFNAMFQWDGTAWVQVQRVFLGIVVSSGASLTSIVNYPQRIRPDATPVNSLISNLFLNQADLTLGFPENTGAVVTSDPDHSKRGLYRKIGATNAGSWGQLNNIIPGYQFVATANSGAGTANAIVATSALHIPNVDGAVVISLSIAATNTGSPVTAQINGVTRTVKTSTGADIPENTLVAPNVVLCMVAGSNTQLRLLSDISTQAMLDTMIAARNAAAASAAAAELSKNQAGALSRVFATDAGGFTATPADGFYLVTAGLPVGWGRLFLRSGAGPGGVDQNVEVQTTNGVKTGALRFPYSIQDQLGNFMPQGTSLGFQNQFSLADCDIIAWIGDSHLEALVALENTGPAAVVSQMIPYRIYNGAIGGQSPADLVEITRENSKFVSRLTRSYDLFGATPWAARNARFVIIEGWTNTQDGSASTEEVRAMQWVRDVPEIVRKVRARGAEPVLMSQMSADVGQSSIRQHTIVENVAQQLKAQTIDVRTARGDYKVTNGPFTDGQHPGARTAELYIRPLLNWAETLPTPTRGIKLYQLRPGFPTPSLKRLVFGSVFQMCERFQEVPIGQWKLKASEQEKFEEKSANLFSDASDQVEDSYARLINGDTLTLNDWALVRIAVPGNAQTLDGIAFEYLGDATAAYVLDHFPPAPRPSQRFATVAAMNANLAFPNKRRALVVADPTAGSNKEYLKSLDSGLGSWSAISTALRDYAGYPFTSLTAMNADLGYNDGTMARVSGDPTPENNGDYVKDGEPGEGSWLKIPDGTYAPNAYWAPVEISTVGGTKAISLGSVELARCMQGNEIYILLNKSGNQELAPIAVHYTAHSPWYPTAFVQSAGRTFGPELLTTPNCSSLTGWTGINSPTAYVPFDLVFGAPRDPANYANPITGVIVVNQNKKIAQSIVCPTAEDFETWLRVIVEGRYNPKPYIDNTLFGTVGGAPYDYRGFPVDQLTVRTGSTTIAANSPIKPSTFNRRRVAAGLRVSATSTPVEISADEMQFSKFGFGLYWGKIQFDFAIPKAATGHLILNVYGPDGDIEIGTVSWRRLDRNACRI